MEIELEEKEKYYCLVTCKGLEGFMRANGWERVNEFSQFGENIFRRKFVKKKNRFGNLVSGKFPLTWDDEYFYFTFPCMPLIDKEDGISYVSGNFGSVLDVLEEVMGIKNCRIEELIDRFDPYDIRHLKMSQIIEYMKSNGWQGTKLELNEDIENPDYKWEWHDVYDAWSYKKEINGQVFASEFAEDYRGSLRGFINHLRMKIAMFKAIIQADFAAECGACAYSQAFNTIFGIYTENEE